MKSLGTHLIFNFIHRDKQECNKIFHYYEHEYFNDDIAFQLEENAVFYVERNGEEKSEQVLETMTTIWHCACYLHMDASHPAFRNDSIVEKALLISNKQNYIKILVAYNTHAIHILLICI